MKIKEVKEQTGLTDRAIRLYIENGLVKPDCDVAYNGRKKFEFSKSDVQQLKNIATLRKADFTIAEIKDITEGGEKSKQTLLEFIKKTTEVFEKNRIVLKLLKPLVDEEDITVEMICKHLDNAVADEPVPVSDMKMNFLEMRENIFYILWSLVGIGIYVFFFASMTPDYLYPMVLVSTSEEFLIDEILLMIRDVLFLLIPLYCPLLLFILRIIRTFFKKIEIEAVSILLSILILFSIMATPFFSFLYSLETRIVSCTDNPDNYLIFDERANEYKDDIYRYFPPYIPSSAKKDETFFFSSGYEDTTKYYYSFHDGDGSAGFKVFAQWQLPKDEFKAEKERLLSKKEDIKRKKQDGDWNFVYYEDYENYEDSAISYIIMFAYNDKTRTVKYEINDSSSWA